MINNNHQLQVSALCTVYSDNKHGFDSSEGKDIFNDVLPCPIEKVTFLLIFKVGNWLLSFVYS